MEILRTLRLAAREVHSRDWIISVTQPSDLEVKSLDTKRAALFCTLSIWLVRFYHVYGSRAAEEYSRRGLTSVLYADSFTRFGQE